MSFFDKRFFQNLTIAALVQTFVLIIAIWVGGIFQDMTATFEAASNTLERIESLVENVTSEQIAEKADAINGAAERIGEGVGDGGSEALNRIGEAWKGFGAD